MDILRCGLCGYEFRPEETVCGRCPMAKGEHAACCPRCGYQIVGPSKVLDAIDRLWRGLKRKFLQGTG